MSNIPDNLKYTESHEWLEESTNEARMGITDHAQELLGDLVFIELPEVGLEVSAGQELGVLESVKAASDYYAPVSGVIVAVNDEVVSNPALLNQDPYGHAWLVKIALKNPSDIQHLLSADEYSETIAGEH